MKRCMIIDDSSVIRKVAKRILGGPDMAIIEAGSGSEALSMCAAGMPDLIVVDNSLPDMTAVDFIRQAMTMDEDVKPHIMICMIELDIGAIMRAKRAGAKGFILKPFDRAQLLDAFRDMPKAA